MAQTTQLTASASEELSSTSEQMSSQAMQLQELIMFFQVGTDKTTPAPKIASGKNRPAEPPSAVPKLIKNRRTSMLDAGEDPIDESSFKHF